MGWEFGLSVWTAPGEAFWGGISVCSLALRMGSWCQPGNREPGGDWGRLETPGTLEGGDGEARGGYWVGLEWGNVAGGKAAAQA